MQLNETETMAMEISKIIREKLKGKVFSTEIYNVIDDVNHRQFKIRFLAYDYFYVVFQYEKDIIGCAIEQGNNIYIPLLKGQHCYSSENLGNYFNMMADELELRIPDKFLKARGWL